MSTISPSTIVRTSLGLEPEGVPLEQPGVCCMCGQLLQIGDLANKATFTAGFTDELYLAVRGSSKLLICGDCTPLTSMKGLDRSGAGAFGLHAALPFRKWIDVATALLNPPVPPFVMCYATAKSQHMAWRSPVNHSQDVFRVRVGLRDLLIRRQRLVNAAEICGRIAAAAFGDLNTDKKRGPKRKTLPNPFVLLSPDLKEVTHGRWHRRVHALAASIPTDYPDFQDDMRWLRTLTDGEVWALRFVLTANPGSSESAAE